MLIADGNRKFLAKGGSIDKQQILIVDGGTLVISELVEFLRDEPPYIFTARNGIEDLEIYRKK